MPYVTQTPEPNVGDSSLPVGNDNEATPTAENTTAGLRDKGPESEGLNVENNVGAEAETENGSEGVKNANQDAEVGDRGVKHDPTEDEVKGHIPSVPDISVVMETPEAMSSELSANVAEETVREGEREGEGGREGEGEREREGEKVGKGVTVEAADGRGSDQSGEVSWLARQMHG